MGAGNGAEAKQNKDLGLQGYDDKENQNLKKPLFAYTPLKLRNEEQRFLVVYPSKASNWENPAHYVRCDLKHLPLADAPPFIAVKNARGYRLYQFPIEINGSVLLVSCALQVFLKHFATWIEKPTTLWIRHVCLIEYDKDEQARYWTREWADKMYSMASEVIDMPNFNAQLIDEGKTRKVVDSNYSSWTKLWFGQPERVVMPEVYPIKLGQRPANVDLPEKDYVYVPLDEIADEIRVIVLVGSPDPNAPLVMHAGHCPIKCEVTYCALSYKWGTDDAFVDAVLSGQKFRLRESLATILRQIRRAEGDIVIWVDAISINQDDVMERSRQVGRMGEIFDNAATVLSYIGAKTDDTDMALELVKELSPHPMMRWNDKSEWHFGPWDFVDGKCVYGENHIGPAHLARMAAAFYKLLTRPYFRRSWILQELAMASTPTVGVGKNFDLAFEKLDKAIYNLMAMLTEDPSLPGMMIAADSSIEKIDVDLLRLPRVLSYFRHLQSKGENQILLRSVAQIRDGSPEFLETLILARGFESTDPRDKIFAVWNLAQDKEGLNFKADYAKSTRTVYIEFAQAWMQQHQNLEIVGAAEPQESDLLESLPTWCPDWSKASAISSLIRRENIPVRMMPVIDDQGGKIYSADGHANEVAYDPPLFSFEEETLCCTGIILDEITFFLPDVPEIPARMLFPFGCQPESYHAFHHWRQELEDYYAAKDITTYGDPGQAATAMFHGDTSSAWLPCTVGSKGEQAVFPLRYTCNVSESKHVLPYAGSYAHPEAWQVVKAVLRGRRPFSSRDGLMGLAPANLAIDTSGQPLQLAVLAGCSVPVILKERHDGSYQFCGTAFVQGWMEGEVLREVMGAENPQEFWETMRETERFRIS